MADRGMEPLKVGDSLGADAGQLVAALQDLQVTAAFRLLGAHGGDDVGAGLLGPIGARLGKAAGGVQERPTVLLGVCLGKTYRVTEVNLTDRSGFKLPFLVGRSFLAERFAVDASRTATVEPSCNTTTASSAFSG